MPRTRSQIADLVPTCPTARKRLASDSDSAPSKKRLKVTGLKSAPDADMKSEPKPAEIIPNPARASSKQPADADVLQSKPRVSKKQPKPADTSALLQKPNAPAFNAEMKSDPDPADRKNTGKTAIEMTSCESTAKRLSKRSKDLDAPTSGERQEDDKKQSGSLIGGCSNVQSSIPGMSIAEIRAVLGEQRKLFQDNGYVSLIDAVCPTMTRMEFDFRYVYGIAVKRHAKHKRASACHKDGDEDDNDDDTDDV